MEWISENGWQQRQIVPGNGLISLEVAGKHRSSKLY